ncbi:hypothetical protein A3762_01565 [Oleiphilus sp. HI0125]|uniref:ketopantoate reductase family protein n=2 Tax=unclassified Oleiphilus TaxID=2631174 RepID=UPI0007C28C44|nr:2-dehydropantoate 2-reductase [Oleiphilus sp. HI0125]KZZ55686.1 hypothetical protein A3762_01565 [Oleiphilus sp. HI0125]
MIAIVGAGAIGQMWAYKLGADNCVFLDTRPNGTSKTINITVQDQQVTNELTVRQHNLQTLKETKLYIEAVLICTKSHAACSTAHALDTNLLKAIPFVLFQNGMGSQHEIVEGIQHRPIYAASTTSGANIEKPNRLVLAGEGTTHCGPLNKHASQHDDWPSSLAKISSHADYKHNIKSTLQRKLLINCGINAFTAIENCSNGQIRSTQSFQQYWPSLIDELSGLSNIYKLELTKTNIVEMILSVCETTAANISSTLQDVRQGKNTEINDINGFAAKQLIASGLSATTNTMLTERVNALRN